MCFSIFYLKIFVYTQYYHIFICAGYIGMPYFPRIPMYISFWYIGMGQICCIPMYRHFGTIIYTSESSFRCLFRCIWQQHTSEWHILDESRCIPLWFARVKTTTEIHLVAACFLWLISREEVTFPPRIPPRNSSPPPNNTSVLESCPELRAHRFHPHSK